MALSWLTALKAVPWADVVQAAPGIVQGARKLFTAAKGYAGSAGDTATARSSGTGGALEERLHTLEAAIDAMQRDQRSSAELIRSLAEQNANIVVALDAMRRRARILAGGCVGLAIAFGALVLAFILR